MGNEAALLAGWLSSLRAPAGRRCPRRPSRPPHACRLPLSPRSPGAGSLLPGTAWLGREPDSSRPGPGSCRRKQPPHPVALRPWEEVGDMLQGARRGRNAWERGRVRVPSHRQAACHKLQAAPGCPALGGIFCAWGEPVAGNAATWFVLPTGHTGGFCTQSHLCPGTLYGHHSCLVTAVCLCLLQTPSPCSWLPRAGSALSLAASCPPPPPGAQDKCTHGTSGGSGRRHRGSRGDIEGEQLE